MEPTTRPFDPWMPLALGLSAVVVLLDQVSKWAIHDLVMQPPRVIEVTGFFNLVLTYNCGISFGIFDNGSGCDSTWQPRILSVLAVAVIGALLYWLRKQPERTLALAVGMISGGAVGNVIDRVRISAVIDFLDFHLGDWHWPAFNLADSAIFLGVVLLLLDGLFRGRQESKNEPRKENKTEREE
jgi:signal peptidase II